MIASATNNTAKKQMISKNFMFFQPALLRSERRRHAGASARKQLNEEFLPPTLVAQHRLLPPPVVTAHSVATARFHLMIRQGYFRRRRSSPLESASRRGYASGVSMLPPAAGWRADRPGAFAGRHVGSADLPRIFPAQRQPVTLIFGRNSCRAGHHHLVAEKPPVIPWRPMLPSSQRRPDFGAVQWRFQRDRNALVILPADAAA